VGEMSKEAVYVIVSLLVIIVVGWIVNRLPILPQTEKRKTIVLGLYAVGLLIFAILFVIYLVQTS
jgi:hypothetical protein